jgi:ABC-type branched-subunit amino acid transport system ATPase component/ABC-type branched-subunit amino acid transport system permease subunit
VRTALSDLTDVPAARVAAGVLGAWVLGMVVLPAGVPVGVVALGAVYGATVGLTALGLVLVYRATRIINFAQAELGGLAVAVAVLTVTGWELPYVAGIGLGLVAAGATGAVVETVVVRRFRHAARLILTVATIGVAQIVGAGQLALPGLFGDLEPFSAFSTPFDVSFTIGAINFTGDHVVAVAAALAATAGLGWFLTRSDGGVAVRAAADSEERARLLGVPVARLSRITWVLAALLSGVGAIVLTPIQGVNVGAVAGATALLPALTAAVIGRMTSLPATMAAAIGVGVFEQLMFWSYPRSSVVSVFELGFVLAALLLQRHTFTRTSETGAEVVPPVRPVPSSISRTAALRAARLALVALGVVVVAVAPAVLSDVHLGVLTGAAILSIVAVSLVVLTGWAGQISLGQYAFVGIGAGITGGLLTTAGADLFVAMPASMAIGALAAVVIGVPALRIPGLFLAVATLAFAVPVSEYLLSSANFPALTPDQVRRPELFGAAALEREEVFFWFCAGVAALVFWLMSNLRRGRIGRTLLAVRDNERAAALCAVPPARTKLLAFGLSGALAGLAGSLFVLSVRGVGFGAFNPQESLAAFTMVVVGGLGSLSGAFLGALYVQLAVYFLEGAARLLATGAGLLVLLLVLRGGLGELLVRGRDALVARYARRRGLAAPGFLEAAADVDLDPPPSTNGAGRVDVTDSVVLELEDVDVSYGSLHVIHDVTLSIPAGQVTALLGTNGAGKSTLLKAVAGLVDAGGTVTFEGAPLEGRSAEQRVAGGIAMVPGGRGVFPNLTVEENLRVAGWLVRNDPATRASLETRVLEEFPRLADRRGAPAGSLSGGEQQMLAIAMAEMCRPRLLLIDELSLGLAPAVVAALLESVRRMVNEGVSVVVVEQSLNVAAALAPRAVFLERGRTRFDGPTEQLTERGDLARAVFLGAGATARPAASPRREDDAGDVTPAGGLEVRDVSVRFGGIVAVDGASLEVAPGEIVGLIGSNGAGKTTLLDVCSGFGEASSGRVLLGGVDVTEWSPERRAELGLGRVFQDARLFPTLTVTETVLVAMDHWIDVREPLASALPLAATRRSEAAALQVAEGLLETLALTRYANSFVSELSTGTRRVVELACVMAARPAMLLLDEPSSGLAQRESEALAGVLRDLRRDTGMAMLVVEHDIPLVRGLVDRLVCMHLGQVIADGAPDDVLARPEVVESYLGTDAVAIERSGAGAPARVRP